MMTTVLLLLLLVVLSGGPSPSETTDASSVETQQSTASDPSHTNESMEQKAITKPTEITRQIPGTITTTTSGENGLPCLSSSTLVDMWSISHMSWGLAFSALMPFELAAFLSVVFELTGE
jgi:hypothetical protein